MIVAGYILLGVLCVISILAFVGCIIYMFGRYGAVRGSEDRVKRLREEGRI